MLVLSRKLNESICIGEDIVVKVVKIRGNVIGLGIVAPESVKIMRTELLERDAQLAGPSKSGNCAMSAAG
jgi:carbon storage regulator